MIVVERQVANQEFAAKYQSFLAIEAKLSHPQAKNKREVTHLRTYKYKVGCG
ncbi:hypothetical protein RIVM261_065570 [Rivularia sp. IAM M-261]|nr:hypothetical protein CAL7716_052300 [Calothrix sp. PCC 7716]GJD21601.1 hypothetical protein RIVM261_065570 [Rivularia sp. IAM M-261]